MRKISYALYALICLAASLTSCSKKYEPGLPTEAAGPYGKLLGALRAMARKPDTVTVDVDATDSFYSSMGTLVYLDTMLPCLTGPSGPVSGKVQFIIEEYLDNADMLFSRVEQSCAGKKLVSGGGAYIRAIQDGNELSLATDKHLVVYLPQKRPSLGMAVYTGYRPDEDAATVWSASSNAKDTTWYRHDSTEMIINSLGYLNIGRRMNDSNMIEIAVDVSMPTGNMGNNFEVYAMYSETNSVVRLEHPGSGRRSQIPYATRPVHFVAMGIVNGYLYAGISTANPVNEGVYLVGVSKVDTKDMLREIKALP